jgi:hypothetical protein
VQSGESPEKEIKIAQLTGVFAQMSGSTYYTDMHEGKTSRQYGGLNENPQAH